MKTKLAIASDLSGFALKQALVEHLAQRDDLEILDLGIESADAPRSYVEQAPRVAQAIQRGEAQKGILLCGTGQGMAIVANKHKGVYACVVDSIFAGERAAIVNNANVITLGGWVTAPFLAAQIVDAWLSMQFTQKMEFKRDFLTHAFAQLQALEQETFK